MESQNKRHYKRFTIEGLGIHCRKLTGQEAALLELTAEGARVSLGEAPVLEREYTLRMDSEGFSISVLGVLVSGGEKAESFEAEMKFTHALKGGDKGFLDFLKTNIRDGAVNVRLLSPDDSLYSTGNYHINQISFGGMRIVSDEKMDVGNSLQLDIVFPMNKPPIKVMGRVASCAKISENVPVKYHVGIEFLEMNRNDMLRLKDFIYFIQDL
jgi:hypothetical protein